MGLMDTLFGKSTGGTAFNGPAAPPAAPAPAPAASSPAPAPAPAPEPTPAAPPSSPLDSFSKMWDNPVDAEGKPVVHVDPLSTNPFNFDSAKINEASAKLDFTQNVNKELLDKVVTPSGQLDTAVLLQLINAGVQQGFAAATINNGNMMNAAIVKNNANLKTALPSTINKAQLDAMSVGDNPVLSHPSVEPLVTALKAAQFQKNPNANPADVAKQVGDYITGLAAAINASSPEAIVAKQKQESQETDFYSFMGGR